MYNEKECFYRQDQWEGYITVVPTTDLEKVETENDVTYTYRMYRAKIVVGVWDKTIRTGWAYRTYEQVLRDYYIHHGKHSTHDHKAG